MEINIWRDPYDCGMTLTKPEKIELKPGLTVLVGCNGAGKTTLMHNIKTECKKNKIPTYSWDNMDSANSASSIFGAAIEGLEEFGGSTRDTYGLLESSEGESLMMRIARQSKHLRQFIDTGEMDTWYGRFEKILHDIKDDNKTKSNVRVIMFDASDSGVSIDHIVGFKEGLLLPMVNYAERNNIELYLILSSNEYELCNGTQCFDVISGEYLTFDDYSDYRDFILKSRDLKDQRLDEQARWIKEKKENAIKLVDELMPKIAKSPQCQLDYINKCFSKSGRCSRCNYQDECCKIQDAAKDNPEVVDKINKSYPDLFITKQLNN